MNYNKEVRRIIRLLRRGRVEEAKQRLEALIDAREKGLERMLFWRIPETTYSKAVHKLSFLQNAYDALLEGNISTALEDLDSYLLPVRETGWDEDLVFELGWR